MKRFINDIITEWKPLKYFPKYIYTSANAKQYVRRLLIIINKEVAGIFQHLINTPLSLLLLVVIICFAIITPSVIDVTDLASFLYIVSGFIISFISVLVAAAIFVSTLHRQSSNKSVEEDIKYLSVINGNRETLLTVYGKYSNLATDLEKIKLFKSTPCDSVFENIDYEKYKQWHSMQLSSLSEVDIPTFDQYIRHPYNLVTSMAYSRSFYMIDGCDVAMILLEKSGKPNIKLKRSVTVLRSSSKRFQTAGTRGYYIPVEFVGRRLYRVIAYSLVSLMFILSTGLFKDYKLNLLSSINIGIQNKIYILTIMSAMISIYLILRYVFKFIAYLRQSTSYSGSILNNMYIYEPDPAMHDSNSMYGI